MTSVSMASSSNVPSVPSSFTVRGASTTRSLSFIDKTLSFCGLMRIKKFEVALAQRTTQMQETINQLESTTSRQQREINRLELRHACLKEIGICIVGNYAIYKLLDLTGGEVAKILGKVILAGGVLVGGMLALDAKMRCV